MIKVKTVFAHVSVDNEASIKTAEKPDFVKTGERYYEVFRGEKYLHDIYALTFVR